MTAIGGLRRNEAAAHPRTWIERRGESGLARNRMDGFSPGSRGMAWGRTGGPGVTLVATPASELVLSWPTGYSALVRGLAVRGPAEAQLVRQRQTVGRRFICFCHLAKTTLKFDEVLACASS